MNSLPTESQLAELPRWAIVSFAARCARRVEPFVVKSLLDEQRKDAVLLAIRIAEQFAYSPRAVDADAKAKAKSAGFASPVAFSAAYSAVAVSYHAQDLAKGTAATRAAFSAYLRVGNAAYAAAEAARAAAFSADDRDAAPRVHPVEAKAAAAKAVNAAHKAVASSWFCFDTGRSYGGERRRDPKVTSNLAAMMKDFATIQNQAFAEQWTNDTPLPPNVFGELWPEGAPNYEENENWRIWY